MSVQFPEAYAHYEYQHDSKRFTKVVTPVESASANNSSMFRHIVPQQAAQPIQRLGNETDEEADDAMVGTNERAIAPALKEIHRKSELGMVGMSPGTKMRQSHTK